MAFRDRLHQLQEVVEDRTGVRFVPEERLNLLEASDQDRRTLQRELDLLAYTALDYVGGAPQELKAPERRKLAQQSRVAWMKDPLAGASVELMNEFTFGRGLPRPKANDEEVQKVLDDFWDDPDNQLVLTSYQAQLGIGTDLSLQSNLFFLVFDDGEDGKIKLGLLDHDSVQAVVRDPDNRLRILYFVAHETRQEWDYKTDQPANVMRPSMESAKVVYYEHWRNVEDVKEMADADERTEPELAPADRTADGRVYHIAINKTTEMAFGHPQMDRLLRWYNAYNKFMDARVDIMEASASFVMKRKIKGTPAQLQKQATQALSRTSPLGQSYDYPDAVAGPKNASIITENENVTHEDFNINTNAPAAAQDAQMLRAQVSAGTRFPQSYYGDATNMTAATGTTLELPVLKTVENRQEVIESLVRFGLDRAVERAVEVGRISDQLSEEEIAKQRADDPSNATTADAAPGGQQGFPQNGGALGEAHEDAVQDEEDTKRDLGYEFSMPNPLKRMMTDLITSIMNIARTFDPNNTNPELSRVLLQVALGEGLELEDAAGLVEKIFPKGYVDPAIAASQAPPQDLQMQDPSQTYGEFAPGGPTGTTGADGQNHPDPSNPYGVPMQTQMQQATVLSESARLAPVPGLPESLRDGLVRRRGERVGLDDTVLELVRDQPGGRE